MAAIFRRKSYVDLTPSEVEGMLSQSDIQIIDVREVDEYKLGHLPGAKLLPLDQLDIRKNEIDSNKEVIVYCLSGGRSEIASKYLSHQGFKVKNMVGGINSWKGKIEK